jgi:hypothetical protein
LQGFLILSPNSAAGVCLRGFDACGRLGFSPLLAMFDLKRSIGSCRINATQQWKSSRFGLGQNILLFIQRL